MATVLTTWMTGGFAWLGRQLSGEKAKPPVIVTGNRVPHLPAPSGSASPVQSVARQAAALSPVVDLIAGRCGSPMVVNRPVTQIPPPPDPASQKSGEPDPVSTWLRSLDPAEPDYTMIALEVKGQPGHTTLVQGIRINVRKRSAPPAAGHATVIQLPAECGAGLEPRLFHASLDDAVPLLRPDKDEKTNFPYVVSDQQIEDFQLTLFTHHCDCVWSVDVITQVDDQVGFTPFPTDGSTYHTEPSTGYERRAWGHPDNALSGPWITVPFRDESMTIPPES